MNLSTCRESVKSLTNDELDQVIRDTEVVRLSALGERERRRTNQRGTTPQRGTTMQIEGVQIGPDQTAPPPSTKSLVDVDFLDKLRNAVIESAAAPNIIGMALRVSVGVDHPLFKSNEKVCQAYLDMIALIEQQRAEVVARN